MYEHMNDMNDLLCSIQCLEPRAKNDQIKVAVTSLSKCNGNTHIAILENLYRVLLCGIPLKHTSIGKIIGYMFS